ncbi:12004_t:CDS:2 [Racocetra persica]|uniref:12004_t:CDS:1 n=1 Tax=Racocetra persica TaxID=160502 RepID=A0ACA9L204_9GLOM|nr:12004_t:CDS:2 [Racocetra persica]
MSYRNNLIYQYASNLNDDTSSEASNFNNVKVNEYNKIIDVDEIDNKFDQNDELDNNDEVDNSEQESCKSNEPDEDDKNKE